MLNQADKNIVLIGMRGTGKTAIGRTLADYLKWDFTDIDHTIEEQEGISIPELIKQHDWGHFRDLESAAVERAAVRKQAVISTGGGVILRPENIKNLKRTGIIVLLHSPLEHLKKRVATSNRPSLTGDDPTAELEKLWSERSELYAAAADVTVTFDFETGNKKTDLLRKSKLVLQAIKEM